MFRLYWMACHGATKSYLAWREQQQPRAAQVVNTHWKLCRNSWLRGFGALNYIPCSWIFTFVSVASSPRSYLYSSATSKKDVHIAPMYGKKPISRSARHSFTLSQKSRRHNRSALCVNRRPIRYNFHVGAKAFWYSDNITLGFLHSH